jgi:hypothetical protein
LLHIATVLGLFVFRVDMLVGGGCTMSARVALQTRGGGMLI